MIIDEIMARHGLAAEDVIFRDKIEMLEREKSEYEYAIVTDGYMEWWTHSDTKYYNIIAYYPDPGVYLVKRKAPEMKASESLAERTQAQFNADGEWTGANPYGMEAYFKRAFANK